MSEPEGKIAALEANEKEIAEMKAKIKEVEDGLLAIGKRTYEFGESMYCDAFHKSPSDGTWNQLNQQLHDLRQRQERLTIAASSAAQPAQGELYLLIRVFAVFRYVCVFIIIIVVFDTNVSRK